MQFATIRKGLDEVHRAFRARGAQRVRSTEAEIREVPQHAAGPKGRLKLGSLLASVAREACRLSEVEAEHFGQLRDNTSAPPLRFG